ncbi:MAG TPA: glycerophosphodiester phosphodiesterase family protein [Gemmatimonadaceae bacterium]|nr:glycerophosphodiester phosphodiesterase family protein [Gemmatimonadaceae bacterium]
MSHPLLNLEARPVIGHRGAAAYAPENTLPSFELAIAQGADVIELDVRASADGIATVVHDATLDRTTDRGGEVSRLAFARIAEADAGARFSPDGSHFPWRGRGVHIPSLRDVLERFPATSLLIELKTVDAQLPVREALLEGDAAQRCVLMSSRSEALEAFRSPPWVTGATKAESMALLWHALLGADLGPIPYRTFSIPRRLRGVPLPMRLLTRAARAHGLPLHVWTVDSPSVAARLWRSGVCGVVTNAPDVIRAVRTRVAARLIAERASGSPGSR